MLQREIDGVVESAGLGKEDVISDAVVRKLEYVGAVVREGMRVSICFCEMFKMAY
jgi:hypothetical protein